MLELPELRAYSQADALARRDEIRTLVQSAVRGRTTSEWLERFGRADLWCGPVHDYRELAEHPQIRFLSPFEEIQHPRAGAVTVLKAPST